MANKKITIDTSRLFIFNIFHFIKYVMGGEVLPMVALFSLSFILLPFSTLAFLFVNLIVTMMVYKLAFDVFADVAKGNMTPKVRQNYLVTNAIAIKVVAIAFLIEGGLMLLKNKGYDEQYRFYFIVVTAFITPAIYMILALTNSLWVALDPITVFKVIKTSFVSYILFVVFWIATIQLHELIINPFLFNYLPVFIDGIVSSFIEYVFLIINFQIMGYIVFQNRNEFDLEDIGFEKIESDDVEIKAEIIINPIYQRIKTLLAADEGQQALNMVIELQKNGDNNIELQGLYKLAMQKKLYNPTNTEMAKKVHLFLKKNQRSKAFNMVIEHLDEGKDYIEESPADINQLIKHALEINKPQYITSLVKEFHEKYPYHADIVPNYFLLAKALYNDRETRDKSKELLKGLISKHPSDQHIAEVKSWLKGMELMSQK